MEILGWIVCIVGFLALGINFIAIWLRAANDKINEDIEPKTGIRWRDY